MPEQSPTPVPTPVKPTPPPVAKPPEVKQSDAGLSQPPSQNPVKPVVDDNPVPASIRGHKAVPLTPFSNLHNSGYKGDAGAKPKTFDELAAEVKAKQVKK